MKATINGITVEGTPAEIAEYQKIMDDMRREGIYIKPPLGKPPQWLVDEAKNTNMQYIFCKMYNDAAKWSE